MDTTITNALYLPQCITMIQSTLAGISLVYYVMLVDMQILFAQAS